MSVLQLFQKATRSEKVSKVHMQWSFSCHVSTLMYSSTTAAPKCNSLYAVLTMAFSPSYIFIHKPHTCGMLQYKVYSCNVLVALVKPTHTCLWKRTCSLFKNMMFISWRIWQLYIWPIESSWTFTNSTDLSRSILFATQKLDKRNSKPVYLTALATR